MRRLALVLLLAAAGCTVGPNYHRPPDPAGGDAPFKSGVRGLATPDPLPDRWWLLYADPNIDRLVREAFAANTDLRQAIARLEQAEAALREARTDRLPTTELSGGARYRRGQLNGAGATGLTGSGVTSGTLETNTASTGDTTTQAREVYSGGFDVAYELDLFGRIRREIEAARGDVEAQAAAADYTRVTVAAETTRAYVDACAAAQELGIARSSLEVAQDQLRIEQAQFRLGALEPFDLQRYETVVAQAEAALPAIENTRRTNLFNLALLTGHTPQDIDPAADRCTRPPQLVSLIPVGDGRLLIQRRPDIRQAERTLAAQTARVGVAVADLYPRISLGGSIASVGTGLSSAFSRQGTSFAVGPLVSWFFPNTALARAEIAAAKGAAAEALAAFDGTVLGALNETERALTAYATESDRNRALAAALDREQAAYTILVTRARFGAASQIDILDTERTLIQARADLASSDSTLADRAVSVFKALGGGWQQPGVVGQDHALQTGNGVKPDTDQAATQRN